MNPSCFTRAAEDEGQHVARHVEPLGQPAFGVGELRTLLLDLERVEELGVDGTGN